MAYNNPEASGRTWRPALVARLAGRGGRGRGGEGVLGRRAAHPRASSNAAPGLEVLVGGDDWALEGLCAGATGWVSGVAVCAPAECVALYDACRGGDLARARAVYARACCRSRRLDMTPEARAVLQGRAGRARLRGRSGAAAAAAARRRRPRGAAGGARRAAARPCPPHESGALRVARSTPTRRACRRAWSPAASAPIPGATMLERKLHFEAEMDDLRLLLMREPRGHAAMSGAILQPPTRAGRRLGRPLHRGLGLPADVRARHDRASPRCWSRPAWSPVTEPETVVRLDTPAGLVEARVAVEDGRAAAVTLRNVPSFLVGTDLAVDVPGVGRVRLRPRVRRQLLPARAGGVRRARGRPAPRRRADRDAGWPIIARDQRGGPAVASGGPAHRRLRARGAHRPGARRRRRARRHGDPPGLARPLAVRDGDVGAARAAARPRAARRRRPFVHESVIGTRFTGPRRRGDDRRGPARDRAGDHRPRVDHRHGHVPARSARPLPGGLRAVSRRRPVGRRDRVVGAGDERRRRGRRRDRRRRGRARARRARRAGRALDRGRVSSGTTGLGEGNVLAADKDAGPELELTLAGLRRLRRAGGAARRRGPDPPQGRAGRAPRRRPRGRREPARAARLGVPGAPDRPQEELQRVEPALTGAALRGDAGAGRSAVRRASGRARPGARGGRRGGGGAHRLAVEAVDVAGGRVRGVRTTAGRHGGRRRRARGGRVDGAAGGERRRCRCRSSRARASSSGCARRGPRFVAPQGDRGLLPRRGRAARGRPAALRRWWRRRGRATCSSAPRASGAASTRRSTPR